MTLWTIGYETAPAGAVFDALARSGAELLVDVRAVANSRRPGFSKRQLAAGVSEIGMSYLHLVHLGTPKEGRLAARSGRHEEMKRIYLAHLATPQAQAALDELVSLARAGRRLCLLCYEHDPRHCHRSFVAEAVSERLGKTPVEHLLP